MLCSQPGVLCYIGQIPHSLLSPAVRESWVAPEGRAVAGGSPGPLTRGQAQTVNCIFQLWYS